MRRQELLTKDKEFFIASARQYRSVGQWQKYCRMYYNYVRYETLWFPECIAHMPKGEHQTWTLESCLVEARKYRLRSRWHNSSRSSYNAAHKNGWVEECTAHMISWVWTKEECVADALRFKTRNEWAKHSVGGYLAAHKPKNNWVGACTAHMDSKIWTKEKCMADAKKYTRRSHWRTSSSAYDASKRLGCFLQCVMHMELGKSWAEHLKRKRIGEAKALLKFMLKVA